MVGIKVIFAVHLTKMMHTIITHFKLKNILVHLFASILIQRCNHVVFSLNLIKLPFLSDRIQNTSFTVPICFFFYLFLLFSFFMDLCLYHFLPFFPLPYNLPPNIMSLKKQVKKSGFKTWLQFRTWLQSFINLYNFILVFSYLSNTVSSELF